MPTIEDILENLEASGYTVLNIEVPQDNPSMYIVTYQDSAGTTYVKKYTKVLKPVTDANGNITGVSEDCVEVP